MTAEARNEFAAMATHHRMIAKGVERDFGHPNEDVAQFSQALHQEHSRWAMLCETVAMAGNEECGMKNVEGKSAPK
jgi:nitrate reductase assembly molybdenum cofactor insertion protein NarJ